MSLIHVGILGEARLGVPHARRQTTGGHHRAERPVEIPDEAHRGASRRRKCGCVVQRQVGSVPLAFGNRLHKRTLARLACAVKEDHGCLLESLPESGGDVPLDHGGRPISPTAGDQPLGG